MTAIVWFRRDLRLADNPALTAAARHGAILPVFLPDDETHGDWPTGAASRVYLHDSLQHLNKALDGNLLLLAGTAEDTLPALAKASGATTLHYNRRHEPAQRQRETTLQKTLAPLPVHPHDGALLLPPDDIRTQTGAIYKVFTPFYRNHLALLETAPPTTLPPPTLRFADPPAGLKHATLPPPPPHWGDKILSHWHTGEHAAANTAAAFAANAAANYAKRRDFPAQDGVSRLSPALHFGEISPRQLWTTIGDSTSPFLRQLIWREFSVYLLHHFPTFPDQNWKPAFDAFPWRDADDNSDALQRWQQGKTGIPIVDAGMRELWQTGVMHNRTRMITASFLTKNLLLHWQHGARWFWNCLVDADLANNSAGWQWVAGSGADAAPYFRIFNPLLQSEKFDPDGAYLARHLPELRELPAKARHRPWEAGGAPGYPDPIVSLNDTRRRALAAYEKIKTTAKTNAK